MIRNAITLRAPAKLNLFLEVTGRRPDGYHDLDSVFQAVSVFDHLTVMRSSNGGVTLSCTDSALSTSSNTAFRAAEAFLDAAGVEWGLQIDLAKHIPLQAGLGGGSSDAAAVLVAANELAGWPLSCDRLREVGAGIGSDVPFFVEGGSAVVQGRGEKVSHFEMEGTLHFVIWYPGFGVSTEAVYKNLRLELTEKVADANLVAAELSQGHLEAAPKNFFNRLEESAFALDGRLG